MELVIIILKNKKKSVYHNVHSMTYGNNELILAYYNSNGNNEFISINLLQIEKMIVC